MKKQCTRKMMLLLALLISSWQTFAQFKVVGYMPSWSGDVNAIQYSKLTHINYAFLLPTSTGGLQGIENASKLQNLVSRAHSSGVKVLIAVGGWNNGDDGAFESLAGNATYRNNFVNNLVNFVNQYGLDGVDMDWEYPDAGASANNYLALMQQLSTAMHSRGKLLTAAVVGSNGNSILSGVFSVVDFLNLMVYDYNNYDHSTYSYATQSLNYWKGRGLPASKAILGVPFYGRPSWESFATLINRGASPYSDTYNGVGYNGITTIKSKTNLAFDQGGGMMMWELSQDATGANSLLSAIHEVVVARSGGGGGNGFTTTIQAENFTSMSGVQNEACTDAGGGQNVGYIETGDWMAYSNITIPASGAYKVEYRVASISGGQLSLDVNAGSTVLGYMNVPATGGWQTWTTVSHTVNINAGTYAFGIFAQAGGWNINWFRITSASAGAAATIAQSSIAESTLVGKINADEQAAAAHLLYPNPAISELYIRDAHTMTGGIIGVYDLSGKQVLYAKGGVQKIDVSTLAPGTYLLVFMKGDKKTTQKFVKQ